MPSRGRSKTEIIRRLKVRVQNYWGSYFKELGLESGRKNKGASLNKMLRDSNPKDRSELLMGLRVIHSLLINHFKTNGDLREPYTSII